MRKRVAIGIVLALLAIFIAVERHAVVRFALAHAIGLATGYSVSIADQRIGASHAALIDVKFSQGRRPVFAARRIDVYYSLRDLLPGSTRRFGLVGVVVDHPYVDIVKYADGSYDIPLPSARPSLPALAPAPNPVPLRFFARISDASGSIRALGPLGTPPLGVARLDANGTFDTAARTHYLVTGAFIEGSGPGRAVDEPFTIRGTSDVARGYAVHRMTARVFPMQSLADMLIGSPDVRVLGGTARNFDARVFGIAAKPGGAIDYHVSLGFDLLGGSLKLVGLIKPVENIGGRIGLFDQTFYVRNIHATLAGIPMDAEGAIYDFSRPQIRIAVNGGGDMNLLRTAFAFSADQPLAGPVRLGILVEGSLGDPSIVVHATSPEIRYRGFPFDDLRAGVQYFHHILALSPLRAFYGGVAAHGGLTMELGEHIHERMLLKFSAPASRLPYAGSILGSEPLVGDAAVDGHDLTLHVTGTLSAKNDVRSAAALFDFDPNGDGSIAPFWMRAGGGELAGGWRMDRPSGTAAFWLDADRLALLAAPPGSLPGLTLPLMPPVSGRISTFGLVGGGSTSSIALAGGLTAHKSAIAGVSFSSLAASFEGGFAGASIPRIVAEGPWGRFDGAGVLSSNSILARGYVNGSLEGLQPLFRSIPAQGHMDGIVAIGISPQGILIQASGLRARGASIGGLPIASADGTVRVNSVSGGVTVYSAHVHAAGGDVVAAGSYSAGAAMNGSGDPLAFVATGVRASSLQTFHLPLDSGSLSASGAIESGIRPVFSGDVDVAQGRAQGFPFSASGGVRLEPGQIGFGNVLAGIDGFYGYANGQVSFGRQPTYDIHAVVPAADIGGLMQRVPMHTFPMTGTLNADIALAGTGISSPPSISGSIGIPAGSVSGLDFLNAGADVFASAGAVSVQNGNVLVGTTHASFGAAVRSGAVSMHLRSRAATLSDFNNFFDTGDTLGGEGRISLSARATHSQVDTSGDIDVKGFRYRSLPIGDTLGLWSSHRNVLRGGISVGGSEGTLHAHGMIAFAPGATLQSTLTHSRYDLDASVQNLDLGFWTAAAGFPLIPVSGRASGDATVTGVYPQIALHGTAALLHGTIGRFPVNEFEMAFGSEGRRLVINHTRLLGPGIAVSARGSAGFQPKSPIDLTMKADTSNLPLVLRQITSAQVPAITGTFSAGLHVGGIVASPVFDASFKGSNVDAAGVPIRTLFGDIRLHGSDIELHNAGATFPRGTVAMTGTLPIHLRPFGLPRHTPVNFSLNATGVDASVFNTIFGHGTQLGGILDMHMSLAGTVEHPNMSGTIALRNGSYRSDFDITPIDGASGMLAFNGSTIDIRRFVAYAGTGRIELSGRADVAGPSGPTMDATLRANGAQFASSTFGTATIDANLSLVRKTGDALLSGTVTATNTTLPFSLFLGPAVTGATGPAWPLAFNMQLVAGPGVRIRGGGLGAGMDLSAAGGATLAGTIGEPTLSGTFAATGGSLTYIDRSFRLLSGAATFAPAQGIVPSIHAVAQTTVVNPDPNVARNPYGTATITIVVDGPIDDLAVNFHSDPAGYSQQQIIAMLAPLGGFVGAIQFPNAYQATIPGGAAPAVNNAPLPGGVFVQSNGAITVSQEAFNLLNSQFGTALLSPVENVLGSALGISDVNLTMGYFGNVGVSVRKVLGKTVSAVYQSTFGVPSFQSFGVRIAPNVNNAASLSFYYETGPQRLFATPGTNVFGPVLFGEPLNGQSGFSFDFRHYF
jgi:hypothetical protein